MLNVARAAILLFSALWLRVSAARNSNAAVNLRVHGDLERDQNESEVPADAISKPCERGSNTSVFRHLRLGNYTPQEVMEARCDEPLLVLLQRELLRVQEMQFHSEPKTFLEKFPKDFMLNQKNRQLIVSTVMTSLTALTVTPLHLVVEVDSVILHGDSIADYAAFCKGVLQEDLGHPGKHAKQLVEKGAAASTPFWRDVPLGALQDVYRMVSASWGAVARGGAITVRKVKLLREPNSTKGHLEELEAGTMLKFAPAKSSSDFPVQKLENPERVVAHGFVLVRFGLYEGWIAEDAVAPWAWLTYKGEKKLPICLDKKPKCSKSEEVVGYIRSGQTFKVEGLDEYWKVVGSGGFVPKDTPELTGPLSPEDALEAQREAKAALALDNKAIKDSRVVSAINDVWNSNAATHSKFGVGIGLTVGGILSHGLGFLFASLFYGVGTAGADAALAVKITEQILSQVTYMELSLLHFELDLVSGTTSHQQCDVKKGTLCPAGFTCVRQMAFVHRDSQDAGGWCVHAPYSNLEAKGTPCSVDMDCASGICNFGKGETLVEMLQGTCSA